MYNEKIFIDLLLFFDIPLHAWLVWHLDRRIGIFFSRKDDIHGLGKVFRSKVSATEIWTTRSIKMWDTGSFSYGCRQNVFTESTEENLQPFTDVIYVIIKYCKRNVFHALWKSPARVPSLVCLEVKSNYFSGLGRWWKKQ
jgi:hypothetical protein